MAFTAGHFYFGSTTVDVGFDPQAVIFFGGNQSTEDAIVSGSGPAIFFGVLYRTAAGGTDRFCVSNGDPGVRWQQKPITCFGAGGGVDMEAEGSLGSGSFSISPSTSPGGSRLVHYLAIGELDGFAGFNLGSGGGTHDFTLGFRPLSTLWMYMYAGGAAQNGHNTSANFFSLGAANFPDYPTHNEVDDFNNNGGAYTFQAGGNTTGTNWVFTNFFNTSIGPHPFPAVAGGFYNDGVDHMQPYPTFISENARMQVEGATRGSPLFMSCNGHIQHAHAPDAGIDIAYGTPDYMDDIEAALFFGPAGFDHLNGLSPTTAYMYGVLTPDYQGCTVFDRRANHPDPPMFFQSKELCYADSLFSAGSIRTASGEIDGDQVILTGETTTVALGNSVLMQTWGPDVDLQQFFRRLPC